VVPVAPVSVLIDYGLGEKAAGQWSKRSGHGGKNWFHDTEKNGRDQGSGARRLVEETIPAAVNVTMGNLKQAASRKLVAKERVAPGYEAAGAASEPRG